MLRKMLFIVAGLVVVIIALITLRHNQTARRDASGNPIDDVVVENPERQSRVVSLPSARISSSPTPATRTSRIERDTPSTSSRTLRGTVKLIDGTPLGGAVVSANFNTSATTDASGHYELTNLPNQVWGINAAHQDAITSMVRNIRADQNTLDFLLRRKAAVKFTARVFNAVTQAPVTEYNVQIANRPVLKDASKPGHFEITEVFTGDQLSFKLESPGTIARDVREWIPSDTTGTIVREYALGSGGTIKGRVVRGSTKSPVPGVQVALVDFGGGRGRGPGGRGDSQRSDRPTSATTGEDGKFVIERLRPGMVLLQLKPESPLMEAVKMAGELQHNEQKDVGDLVIGEGGTIQGKVVRLPGSEPVSGVRVELTGFGLGFGGGGNGGPGGFGRSGQSDTQGTTTTGESGTAPPASGNTSDNGGPRIDARTTSTLSNEKGEFEFTRVAPGPNTLRAQIYHLRESVNMTAEETKEVTLRVGSGTLRGTVLKDLKPVSGDVSVSRASTGGFFGGGFGRGRGSEETDIDENGLFEIKDLAPGKWQVSIDVENARSGTFEVEIPNNGVLEKTFNMPSGDLVGRVVDAQDQPIAGARISTSSTADSNQSPFGGFGGFGGGGRGGNFGGGGFGGGGRGRGIESGADGTFRIQDQAPGTMVVMAEKEGLGFSEQVEGQVPEQGDSAEVILKIGAGETGSIVSTALYVETGGPIANAYCNLTTSKGTFRHSERRGENGVMTIPKVPAGTYTVEVGANGYTTSEQTVQVTASQPAEVTHVLSAAGSFRWSVVDANGAGVGKATCTLNPQDPNSIEGPRQGVTTDSGQWFVRGVIPGAYTATCTSLDGKSATSQVTITAGTPSSEVAILQ